MRNIILLLIVLLAAASSFSQSGGQFSITSSVTGAGGGASSGGTLGLTGTAAQPAVDLPMSGSAFGLRGGFWQPEFAPTSAPVSIRGRVLIVDGGGLRNAVVTLTGPNVGEPLVSRTTSFGYFSFEGLEVGQVYIVTVTSRRYVFSEPSQTVIPFDSISDMLFRADGQR